MLIELQRLESEDFGFPSRQDPSVNKFGPDDLEGTACRVSGGVRYTIGVRWLFDDHGVRTDSDCGNEGFNYNEWKAEMSPKENLVESNDFLYAPRASVEKEPEHKRLLTRASLKKFTSCFGFPFRCLYWHQF